MRFVFLSLLFALSAALITYWQTTRMTHLVDYSYQVEIAHRMFLGQVPYRDFFLVLTPGVYVVMSLVMKLTGGYSHLWVVLQSMTVAALTSLVSFFVFWRITKSRWFTCLLSLALLPVGHAIYPYPNYDIWAVLFMLCAILCWTHLSTTRFPQWVGLFLGIFSAGSFFFKQTIGGTFAVLMLLAVVRMEKRRRIVMATMVGEGLVFGLFLSWLWWQNAIGPFVRQVFVFPQSARDPWQVVGVLLADYQQALQFLFPVVLGGIVYIYAYRFLPRVMTFFVLLVWSVLLSQFVLRFPSMVRVGLTSIWTVGMLLAIASCIRKKQIKRILLVLVLITTVHAGFLSQSIVGSHYGMWPLFYVMVSLAFVFLSQSVPRFWMHTFLGFAVGAIVISLTWYALTNEFTQYVNMKGPIATASAGKIKGLSAPGPWIPAFDSLLDDVAKRIPATDRVAFLPGDDPFYAATSRIPVLRCSQWNTGTCDTFGFELEQEIREKRIQWIIVKNQVMTPHAYPLLGWIPVDMGYRLEAHIAGVYDIYHWTL